MYVIYLYLFIYLFIYPLDATVIKRFGRLTVYWMRYYSGHKEWLCTRTEQNIILFRRKLLQLLVYHHAYIIISQGHDTKYIWLATSTMLSVDDSDISIDYRCQYRLRNMMYKD